MLKIVASAVLGFCGLVCCAADASACNGGCCSQSACYCAMNMSATMQGMPGMPEMPAPPQASVGSQYRRYSYQPAPTAYRSLGRSANAAVHDAGFKIRGGR